MRAAQSKIPLFIAVMLAPFMVGQVLAQDSSWRVGKTSGEVWVSSDGAQQASLSVSSDLKAGDKIETGKNGRALLQRGAESILISPNSVIGIPKQNADGMQTTIIQQAGSILLEVEKKNVAHFEVETPFLAAVVKGTQFRVSVGANKTSVQVTRGQVQVSDFKTGQIAQVVAGQSATTFAQGKSGLSLSGNGKFSPIQQGEPRATSVSRIAMPKADLLSRQTGARHSTTSNTPRSKMSADQRSLKPQPLHHARSQGAIRISAPLGDVRIDVQKVTNGLVRGNSPSVAGSNSNRELSWASGETKGSANSPNGNSSGSGPVGNSNAAVTASPATMPATGNGNNGNGNGGNGNGGNGNGNGNGNDNEDSGKGKGANGNGHGHAYGHNKH